MRGSSKRRSPIREAAKPIGLRDPVHRIIGGSDQLPVKPSTRYKQGKPTRLLLLHFQPHQHSFSGQPSLAEASRPSRTAAISRRHSFIQLPYQLTKRPVQHFGHRSWKPARRGKDTLTAPNENLTISSLPRCRGIACVSLDQPMQPCVGTAPSILRTSPMVGKR